MVISTRTKWGNDRQDKSSKETRGYNPGKHNILTVECQSINTIPVIFLIRVLRWGD